MKILCLVWKSQLLLWYESGREPTLHSQYNIYGSIHIHIKRSRFKILNWHGPKNLQALVLIFRCFSQGEASHDLHRLLQIMWGFPGHSQEPRWCRGLGSKAVVSRWNKPVLPCFLTCIAPWSLSRCFANAFWKCQNQQGNSPGVMQVKKKKKKKDSSVIVWVHFSSAWSLAIGKNRKFENVGFNKSNWCVTQ